MGRKLLAEIQRSGSPIFRHQVEGMNLKEASNHISREDIRQLE